MSVSSHIEQLKKKHQHLSDTVETLQRSPAATDAEIASMKKQKLAIKEEITKLSTHYPATLNSIQKRGRLIGPFFRFKSCLAHILTAVRGNS